MGQSLDSVVCRVMLLTSSFYSTWNNVTVEFSTPVSSTKQTNSMLFCMNDPQWVLNQVRG